MKKYIPPLLLAGLFVLLIFLSLPSGCVYGSNTDWLSQHAALAETIRTACLEQKTLLPDILPLGGGSNGFQFSYYGYLRPDILIGCLLPSIPMYQILIFYSLAGYLAAVLLFYLWLRRENLSSLNAFAGSLLFLTASCFFHTHRQLMFINYMPFLILSLLAVQKKPGRMHPMLPFFLLLICLHSFYYAPACFLAVGWYWYQKSGRAFWKPWLGASFLAAGLSAALLLPTGLVILEHHRASAEASRGFLTFFGNLSSLLYSPYGLGLTMLALYLIFLGLGLKKYRRDSLIFLILMVWGGASYLLNATLYARAKILIPFLPLLLLHGARLLADLRSGKALWNLWPFLPMAAVALQYLPKSFRGLVLCDFFLLLAAVLLLRSFSEKKTGKPAGAVLPLLFVMPFLFFLHSASTEDFVTEEQMASALSTAVPAADTEPLYRFDSLSQPLAKGNADASASRWKSTMYSSVYNNAYSRVYYDLLKTPIQINNRLAILAAGNPFLLHFMGIRYLETPADQVPDGYRVLMNDGKTTVCENPSVLPVVYLTDDTLSSSEFHTLSGWKQAEALTRFTIVPEEAAENTPVLTASLPFSEVPAARTECESQIHSFYPSLSGIRVPSSVKIQKTGSDEENYEITAEEDSRLSITFRKPLKQRLLLLQFEVENHTGKAVVITINGIKNKLSAGNAPYPNGNRCFQYQFLTTSEKGLDTLEISLSKGRYTLKNIRFGLLPADIFSEKSWTPVEALEPSAGEFFACRAEVSSDTWLVTSIPRQNGMSLLIDGEPAELITVNEAFAGARLPAGEHEVRLRLEVPDKKAGLCVSVLSFLSLLIWIFYQKAVDKPPRKRI